jgi:uncharacterized membrane protein
MKPTFFVLSILGLFASVHLAWANAFLLNNGVFTIINVPGASDTAAEGINSLGQIVGSFADSTGRHGFLDTITPAKSSGHLTETSDTPFWIATESSRLSISLVETLNPLPRVSTMQAKSWDQISLKTKYVAS